MDGENKGKPYEQMDDLGGKNPYFWKHPYILWPVLFSIKNLYLAGITAFTGKQAWHIAKFSAFVGEPNGEPTKKKASVLLVLGTLQKGGTLKVVFLWV